MDLFEQVEDVIVRLHSMMPTDRDCEEAIRLLRLLAGKVAEHDSGNLPHRNPKAGGGQGDMSHG